MVDTYAYGTRKDLASEKEEIKCSNIIKWQKKPINDYLWWCYKRKHEKT